MTDTATATTVRRDRIVAAISSALIEILEYDLPEITEDSRLFDQLGLDSTGVFELLMRLEEALDVEFDTDNLEMGHFETVRSLADFVVSETGD
ncbi:MULTISPECIES: acyl carrier protein [Protofrankia]|uniref:Acyl carrier protein n=1 Tax=Protofrankia coriariae TaxID=1562887 RepID=A0ABR5F644_9ACTN|nr:MULTISPECIES: acyl carrier protein [Protofrankia]KLL12201.1 acyl carrier protein [Protofrankia coriariae]ONH37573.1 acyl carrier protein [Protofrankia sp. BMG5.30]